MNHILWVGLLFVSCVHSKAQMPSDSNATQQTKNLYKHLQQSINTGFLFGHQDDLAYGVNWKYQEGRSDIHDVTGDYPALFGWELGRLEVDHPVNLDSVPFDRMKGYIRDAYKKGSVVTISWHLNNPLTGKSAWDPSPPETVQSVLPGGSSNSLYQSWLDKVANFMNDLKGDQGEYIPVIFRPFHELNGNWFWWGGNHATADQFKQLWIFTVNYLRNVKGIHHLLIAYNTDRFATREDYINKYPGDEWVDILGFDIYQRTDKTEKYIRDMDHMLSVLDSVAIEHHKIPALTEFGGDTSNQTWWTGTFLKAIGQHKIAYAMAWRNAGLKWNGEFEYYVPYKGERSANDFVNFYKANNTLFQKDLIEKSFYK